LIWKHPLSETVAFFAGQKAFISGDTGPTHLAAALGLPMLTIFVSSKKEQYGYHDGRFRFAVSYDGSVQQREQITESIKILTRAITHGIHK
jgi:ADP-heptose:LPS heptosyltransferase